MKLAIMQPYFFPHAAYFRLAASVDHFVFLDDVTFIKQGWINRNRILLNDKPAWFTVPVAAASSHVLIRDTIVDGRRFPHWCGKFLKTLRQHYAHAPHRDAVIALVEQVVTVPGGSNARMSDIAIRSVTAVMAHLGLPFHPSLSSALPPSPLRGVDRVLDLCRHYGATTYINSAGGRALYREDTFAAAGIALQFVDTMHTQPDSGSGPGVEPSILHLLMHRDPQQLRQMLCHADAPGAC